MTQEEIIKMAREAFGEQNTDYIHPKALERFARIITANLFTYDQVKAHIQAAVITEREACAKVCEPVEGSAYELGVYKTMQTLAAAIRARSEQ